MTTYSAIPNSDIDQDSPVTVTLMTHVRDNPIAAAEGATDAPVNAAAWHPYNQTHFGDGNDGVIYDHSVDGDVSTIESPTFDDGYEYAFAYYELSHDVGTDQGLELDLYKATSGVWRTAGIHGGLSSSDMVSGWVTIVTPHLINTTHIIDSGKNLVGDAYHATAQKVTKARFGFDGSGDFDSGKVIMYRRRVDV